MVSAAVLGWGGLVLALCLTTFGVWWCATLAVCLVVFIVGGLTLLYLLHWEATLKYTADLYRRRSHDIRPGLSRVVSASQAAQREPPRLDRRITGAQAVDETLQEVLALVLRDYLQPWYNRLSADDEFPREVRRTAQRLAVNFAGSSPPRPEMTASLDRVKEVDWIPYLTTRLVDDAASHLRLFRQVRAKAKQQQQPPPSSGVGSEPVSLTSLPSGGGDAASKSGGASPVPPSQHQHGHRRTGSSVSLGANATPQAGGSGSGSHSPQQHPQSHPHPQPELEPLFFDLEVTMEGGDLCRDLVCTDPEYEKQFLRDLSEVVMFLLLPPEDFQCKALRFLLRELLVSSVLLPLFALFSDPDYINQIIVWLVCKEIPLTSEAFLTALRVTDNRDELTATREIVVREIAQLRSRDSGGEDDTWVKQQLSSLQYLRKVVDARLQRLKDGADSDSAGSDGVVCTPTCASVDGSLGVPVPVPPDSGSPEGLPAQLDWGRLVPSGGAGGVRLFSLPLDVVLKNNVALSYFIDYMTSIGAQAYLFFYLNVEGWRVSAEQQISDLELHKMGAGVTVAGAAAPSVVVGGGRKVGDAPPPTHQPPQPDSMREAAYSIFEQYLSEKASPRLRLDETVVRKLLFRIRTEAPHETWFDEAQAAVYEKLQTEERFLPGFRASVGYVRLLAELDLLREPGSGGAGGGTSGHGHGDDEEDSAESSLSDNVSLASFESDSATVPAPAAAAAALLSDPLVLHGTGSTLSLPGPPTATSGSDCGSVASSVSSAASAAGSQFLAEKRQGPSSLTAEIIETGIVNDRGKTYGIYAVSVSRRYEVTGHVDKWHVYRRYSDFHELHSKIKDKYGDLGKLTFPGKKTFHNMERAVLEKRMKMLNDYLQIVMQPGVVGSHPQLRDLLAAFLEQGDYGGGGGGGGGGSSGLGVAQVSHALDSLVVNPLKNSMRSVGQAVRTVPDNLLSTVDGVVDGLSRVFGSSATSGSLSGSSHGSGSASSLAGAAATPALCEATKVGASIDTETADNIPLRIMLLLMDEVFDLKQRNQWLRRRIVTLLRQIIRTMFGDIVNRRILDYVLLMTSPDQVADYLRAFKQALWPNGARAEGRPPRDEATRSRTRVAAKVALLSSLSDELKHIIGSETARRGLLRVFELFQRPVLNRRLLHVLLEGVLRTLFPDNNLEQVFRRLHSRSPRVPRQSSSGGQLKGASKGGGGGGAPPELGLRGEAIAARTR
ncbi:sorting nexin-13-like isoform X2 [Schistocerca gregaria]|uniref:sorting nexin-13-like isoform X2 n=1 Tax=Schistocerca gregaria TaxID=7010 RepID=UPI00211E26EA|nr:sorting nexin-13-like isoform X2 [Schistocerca gregaria]